VTTAVVASASGKSKSTPAARPRPTWLEIIWCYFRY
jgi:hypothetical protein